MIFTTKNMKALCQPSGKRNPQHIGKVKLATSNSYITSDHHKRNSCTWFHSRNYAV